MAEEEAHKKEIYNYDAPWTIYAMGWCNRPGDKFRFRMALGSFVEEYANKIQIIRRTPTAEGGFSVLSELDHPYPATKVMWAPPSYNGPKDLIVTAGDYLRLWSVSDDDQTQYEGLLSTNRSTDHCAPITSFDWSNADPNLLCSSSVDTTCTVWDVQTQQPKTQRIAHDKEVFDIAFSAQNRDVFASVGADGSVRMFDLRSLEHSTILYESQDLSPLLRVAWNMQDSNYLATILTASPHTVILDVRYPAVPVARLGGHQASVNGIAWAPHSSCHICTCSDDKQALIWNLNGLPEPVEDPILAYTAEGEINQLQWSASHEDWIAIAFGSRMQVLRV